MLTEFKKDLQEILSDNHIPTFEINNSENVGVVMTEWDTMSDDGIILPNNLLTSGTYAIEWEQALQVIKELGIAYPIVDDFKEVGYHGNY